MLTTVMRTDKCVYSSTDRCLHLFLCASSQNVAVLRQETLGNLELFCVCGGFAKETPQLDKHEKISLSFFFLSYFLSFFLSSFSEPPDMWLMLTRREKLSL